MRGKRVFWVLALVLVVMSVALALYYAGDMATRQLIWRSEKGKTAFMTLMAVQISLVCLIAPAFSCGAFTLERERQTFDLLTTTLLRPRSIVFGKLLSSLYYIFLIILAPLPLFFFCLLFGGLAPSHILQNLLLIVVVSVGFAMIGLHVSLVCRRTPVATAFAYGVMLLLVGGVPFLFLMTAIMLDWSKAFREMWPYFMVTTPYAGYASVFESEFHIELWGASVPLWVCNVMFYAVLTLLLLWFSIHGFRVRALKEKSARKKKPSGGSASLPPNRSASPSPEPAREQTPSPS